MPIPAKRSRSRKKPNPAEELTELVILGLQEKKAKEISVLDLRSLKHAVTDFFVVCQGDSRTHVEALARSVEDMVAKIRHEDPFHREGLENAQWILVDYVNVVVHIFQKEYRDYYGIEKLWADAAIRQVDHGHS